MKTLLLVAVVAMVGTCSNCGGTLQNVVWPATVTCGQPVANDLVKQVEAILMQGSGTNIGTDAVAALEALAQKNGPQLVACIVEQLVNGWMKPTGTEMPSAQANAAARGQDFLNKKGVTVQTPTSGS